MISLTKNKSAGLPRNDSQKGLEGVIGTIGTFILRVRSKMSNILYGAYILQSDKNANGIQKALDRGIITVINEASTIDFCNLFNYLANNKLGKGFDPKQDPPLATDPRIKKIKYSVQNNAFKLQSLIDSYYAGGIELLPMIRSINLSITSLLDSQIGLTDPELRKEYPEIDLISNFLNDKLAELSSISSTGVIPTNRVQSILSIVDKIRVMCVSIQSLNNPAAIIAIAPNFLQKEIDKLNKIVKPEKLVPLLYRILKVCNNINTVAKTILTYVSRARLIIKLALLLIRIFNVIKAFFLTLPVPNIGTTVGVTTKFSEIYQEKLKEQGEKKLYKVLKQISGVLDDIYFIVSDLIIAINDIIRGLTAILLNIQSCKLNEDLEKEISNAIKNLENTRADLQQFINQVDTGRKSLDNTFGGYTIEIVTEELSDQNINLKRRYGIARALNGKIDVQSTPTFASLDLIIINEVKVLLISKGLVKTGLSDISAENQIIAMEAMKYLDDNDISINNLDVPLSLEDNSEDSIGLQSFVNNLPGGAAMRKRVRKKMIENNENLTKNLKSNDPNSKYSSNILKNTQDNTKNLKIQDLEEEKKKLQLSITAAAVNPALAATIPSSVKRINQIDSEIETLKRS